MNNNFNHNEQQHEKHFNDSENHKKDMNLFIAKQLFEAYCKFSYINVDTHIHEMSSVFLSSLSSLSSSTDPTFQLVTTLTTTQPTSSTSSHPSSTTPSTTTPNLAIPSIIASLIELRSQYIGICAINNTITNNNNNNNNTITITNQFSTNDDVFNYSLFHAALLTNSPIIIDAVLPYINYDFTTLTHDEIDDIKLINTIHNDENEIYPKNYILRAIVDATNKSHYQSILHLINHHQLSPIIPICDVDLYQAFGYTNLLYYSTTNNNPQLIEYLLPLCIKSTNQQLLSQSIFIIARSGHLHLIKQLQNEYNINLSQLEDDENCQNILHYAVQSNNIELLDYLIEDIGLSVNRRGILQSAVEARKWDNMKHLITQHNAETGLASIVLQYAAQDPNITPDMIDYIITTFNITQNEINDTTPYNSPLKSFARSCNVIALKHIIEKYNVNPHCLFFDQHNGTSDSLLHIILHFPHKIKSTQLLAMVKYLICELGLDVNKIGSKRNTPIEILVRNQSESNECRLPIFTLLLQHKAEIRDMNHFIQRVVRNKHFSILQHLIEIYQPPIDVNNVQPWTALPSFHYVIREQPSIELITYLLSLNTIDINQKDGYGNTPIRYAMTHSDLHIDIIQLLINNGATVTINDWLSMFGELSSHSNPYQLFQCLNYFNNTFGFNAETFSLHGQQNSLFRFKTTPLLRFSLNHLKFRYSTIKHNKDHFNMVIIYRALIHHYKANVNDQDVTNKNNTVLHHLATNNHYELIQFTLLHSHYKPNIYLVNNNRETFLHILVSKCDQWVIDKRDEGKRKDSQEYLFYVLDEIRIHDNDSKFIITDDERNDRYDNFENVLDRIIDLL